MVVLNNQWKRIAAIAMVTLASSSLLVGQTGEPTSSRSQGKRQSQASMRNALNAHTSPERVKDLLLANILSTCPLPGSTSPAVFVYRNHSLEEYRGAWNRLVPFNLTEADRLNGIQYKAWVVMSGSSFRRFDAYKGQWSSWASARDLEQQTTPSALARGSNRNMLFAGLHQMQGFAVSMEKKNNQWSFRIEWDGGGPLDPDTLSAEKLSCSAAMSANPLSSGDHR
jgi:hypothetical protein